jgi:hypothetical protein
MALCSLESAGLVYCVDEGARRLLELGVDVFKHRKNQRRNLVFLEVLFIGINVSKLHTLCDNVSCLFDRG